MTNPIIHAAAIEAAACALREAFDMGVDGFEEQARAALEAAAPYMLKELRELVENMEAQPWTEVGTIPGVAALIRSSARGLL